MSLKHYAELPWPLVVTAMGNTAVLAVLTPTLADETPRIGFLAPTDYQQVISRLIVSVSPGSSLVSSTRMAVYGLAS